MRENLIKYITELESKQCAFFAIKRSRSNSVQILAQKDKKVHNKATDNLSYATFNKFKNNDNQIIILGEVIKEFNLGSNRISPVKNSIDLPETDKSSHVTLVRNAIKHMENTDLKKVVLSRKYDVNISKSYNLFFENLMDTYPEANVYYFNHPEVGCWMGATPELLLNVNGNELKTMSLAGTANFQDGVIHNWSSKELEEQHIVTEYIASQLKTISCNNIKIHDLETIRAGNLIHLQTIITAQLNSNDIDDVLKVLHPTPAVCGFPTSKAFNYIKENEAYDREFYTGYFGIIDHKSKYAEYYVNLRCMKLNGTNATLYAGGGITSQSDPEKEYEETQAKLKTISKVLA